MHPQGSPRTAHQDPHHCHLCRRLHLGQNHPLRWNHSWHQCCAWLMIMRPLHDLYSPSTRNFLHMHQHTLISFTMKLPDYVSRHETPPDQVRLALKPSRTLTCLWFLVDSHAKHCLWVVSPNFFIWSEELWYPRSIVHPFLHFRAN